jgi:hypothetical protein
MADFETIPQEAIDRLNANPEFAPQFDTVFGAGRAAELIEAEAGIPQPQEAEDDDWSVIGETFRAIGGGVRDAIQETGHAIQSTAETTGNFLTGGNDVYWTEEKGFEWLSPEEVNSGDYTIPDWQTQNLIGEGDDGLLALPEVAPNKTVVGGIGRGIAQFTAGFLGAKKLTGLKGLRGAFMNGAIADAIVFDPNDPNITAFVETYDVDMGLFGEAMATDPDDPEYINRLRNAAEGVLAGSVVEAIGYSVKALRARRAGNIEEADRFTAQQDEALKAVDDEIASLEGGLRADVDETLDLSRDLFDNFENTRAEADVSAPRAANDNAPVRPAGEPTQLDLGNVEVDGQVRMDADVIPPKAPEVDGTTPRKPFMTPQRVEAARMQAQLAAGASKQTKQAMFSFRSLSTVSDFDHVLDDIAGVKAVMADEFTRIKGGDVQRWATVKAQTAAKLRQMAQMTGEDPRALVRKFMSADMGDMTKMAAEIHARSRYIMSVENELKEMAQAITSGAFDPKAFPGIKDMDQLKLAFNQRREVGAQLLAGQDALRSNVARAMNAMKMSVTGDKNIQAMLRDPATFKDIETAARAVADPANAGSPAIKTINDALGSLHGYMDRVNSFRINALLSGPGTQEVNIISNALNSLAVPLGQGLGAVATGDRKMAVHAIRQFQGSFAGWADSIKAAGQAGWWDDAVLDPFNGKIEDDNLRGLITGYRGVDKVLSAPSRALMTMDEFFKQSSYRGRVFADASWEASEKGLKGDERTAFIQEQLRNAYNDKGAATNGDALLQAQRTTFTEALEPGSLGAGIQTFAVKHPTMRFVVPFVRTPINILSQTLQHSPGLGLASKRLRDDLAAGGVRAAQARGRQALGTAAVGLGLYAASTGAITGSGPSNPAVRAAWLKNNQPYSFRIENEDGTVEFMSYARLEPLSNILSIFADVVEISNDEFNESSKTPMAQALLISVMNNSVNKTFTQGIYDAMSIAVGRQHERKAAVNNLISSFVPNVLNQTNGDDTLRETRELLDAMLAKTHLYNEVDPRRNVIGEPVLRSLPKYDPLGLTDRDRRVVDTVMQEMTRVGVLNQTTIGHPSRRVPGPSQIDLATIPYSDTQSLYDRWIELTGTVEIGGNTLRAELEDVLTSPSYLRAPDGGIGATGTNKGTIIQRVVSRYREKARGELPELRDLITSERRLGASNNREQINANRQLFPQTTISVAPRPRTFEDLLGR